MNLKKSKWTELPDHKAPVTTILGCPVYIRERPGEAGFAFVTRLHSKKEEIGALSCYCPKDSKPIESGIGILGRFHNAKAKGRLGRLVKMGCAFRENPKSIFVATFVCLTPPPQNELFLNLVVHQSLELDQVSWFQVAPVTLTKSPILQHPHRDPKFLETIVRNSCIRFRHNLLIVAFNKTDGCIGVGEKAEIYTGGEHPDSNITVIAMIELPLAIGSSPDIVEPNFWGNPDKR